MVAQQSKKNDSVKYTNMLDAYRAFWRRGFTEWDGTSSRSEYWFSILMTLIISLVGCLLIGLSFAMLFSFYGSYEYGYYNNIEYITRFGATCIGAMLSWLCIISVPFVSLFTRRLHDVGLSAWFWCVYFVNFIPFIGPFLWTIFGIVICVLPTKVNGNPYHKFNK